MVLNDIAIQGPIGDPVEVAVKQYTKREYTYDLYVQESAILQDLVDAMTPEQYEKYAEKTGGFND